jgi:hypothetical protein
MLEDGRSIPYMSEESWKLCFKYNASRLISRVEIFDVRLFKSEPFHATVQQVFLDDAVDVDVLTGRTYILNL